MYVVAVCAQSTHGFSKHSLESIELVAGRGVKGDAHYGEFVQHIFDQRRDAKRPNLRQVHLLETELISELHELGFDVRYGGLGENIVTCGIGLDALSADTCLHIGGQAVVAVTGLREPCVKIDRFRKGLRVAVSAGGRSAGHSLRRAVMAVVLQGGIVKPGDTIQIEAPALARPLELI